MRRLTPSGGPCTTCASRSPTAATSAARTACRRRSSATTTASWTARSCSSFEEIERVARAFVAHGVEKIRITGGEPLLRRDLERLIERLAAIPGLDLTLTTNGLAPRREGGRTCATPACAGSPSASTRSTTTMFRAMNDVDFPVARVLEGIEAAAGGRAPGEGQRRGQARRQRAAIVDLARHFRGHRRHRAVHRVHGRRHDERLAARRRRHRPPRSSSGSTPSSRSSRSSRSTAARSRAAGATATARARSA